VLARSRTGSLPDTLAREARVIAWMLLLGCPRQGCDEREVTVVLGDDSRPFTPLVDGAALEIEMGPQGGWHAFAAVRLDGFDLGLDATRVDELPRVTLQLLDGDTAIAGYEDLARDLPATGELVRERLILYGAPEPYVGPSLTLRGSAVDRCGRQGSASGLVVLDAL